MRFTPPPLSSSEVFHSDFLLAIRALKFIETLCGKGEREQKFLEVWGKELGDVGHNRKVTNGLRPFFA